MTILLLKFKINNFGVFCLTGESGSVVFGSLLDGVFEGKIISSKEAYYVEKASRYLPQRNDSNVHSVIYKDSDVEDPYTDRREGMS